MRSEKLPRRNVLCVRPVVCKSHAEEAAGRFISFTSFLIYSATTARQTEMNTRITAMAYAAGSGVFRISEGGGQSPPFPSLSLPLPPLSFLSPPPVSREPQNLLTLRYTLSYAALMKT